MQGEPKASAFKAHLVVVAEIGQSGWPEPRSDKIISALQGTLAFGQIPLCIDSSLSSNTYAAWYTVICSYAYPYCNSS